LKALKTSPEQLEEWEAIEMEGAPLYIIVRTYTRTALGE